MSEISLIGFCVLIISSLAYFFYAQIYCDCNHWLVGHDAINIVKVHPFFNGSLKIFYCTRCKKHYISCSDTVGMEDDKIGDMVSISELVYNKLKQILESNDWESKKIYGNLTAMKDVLVVNGIKFYDRPCKYIDAGWLSPMMQVFGLTGEPPYPHIRSKIIDRSLTNREKS